MFTNFISVCLGITRKLINRGKRKLISDDMGVLGL
jgi:hypothetical protein